MARRQEDLLRGLAQLNQWIKELDPRLKQEAEGREAARRLMTHPGVGPLTALGTVLVRGPVERFPDAKHVTRYVGLIPQEESSGSRQRFGHLTKQGNPSADGLRFFAGGSGADGQPLRSRAEARLSALGFSQGQCVRESGGGAQAGDPPLSRRAGRRDGIDYTEFVRRGSHAGMLGDGALA